MTSRARVPFFAGTNYVNLSPSTEHEGCPLVPHSCPTQASPGLPGERGPAWASPRGLGRRGSPREGPGCTWVQRLPRLMVSAGQETAVPVASADCALVFGRVPRPPAPVLVSGMAPMLSCPSRGVGANSMGTGCPTSAEGRAHGDRHLRPQKGRGRGRGKSRGAKARPAGRSGPAPLDRAQPAPHVSPAAAEG